MFRFYGKYPFITAVEPDTNPLPECIKPTNERSKPLFDLYGWDGSIESPGYLTLPGRAIGYTKCTQFDMNIISRWKSSFL